MMIVKKHSLKSNIKKKSNQMTSISYHNTKKNKDF